MLVNDGAAPATTIDYKILAAGSTAASTWRSQIESDTLSACDRHLETYVEYEENGTWIDIWNDLSGSTGTTWNTWLKIKRNGDGDVTFTV